MNVILSGVLVRDANENAIEGSLRIYETGKGCFDFPAASLGRGSHSAQGDIIKYGK